MNTWAKEKRRKRKKIYVGTYNTDNSHASISFRWSWTVDCWRTIQLHGWVSLRNSTVAISRYMSSMRWCGVEKRAKSGAYCGIENFVISYSCLRVSRVITGVIFWINLIFSYRILVAFYFLRLL